MGITTHDLQVTDAVEYIDDETREVFTGTILEVQDANKWDSPRAKVEWSDGVISTIRTARLRRIRVNQDEAHS